MDKQSFPHNKGPPTPLSFTIFSKTKRDHQEKDAHLPLKKSQKYQLGGVHYYINNQIYYLPKSKQ